jgi:hypothetical protein
LAAPVILLLCEKGAQQAALWAVKESSKSI